MNDAIKDHILDRPLSYIGRSVPRPNARRLLEGKGTFTDDIRLPRMVHLAYLRSPYAHAEIAAIDKSRAERAPGVVAVVSGQELAEYCTPWVGVLTHLPGLKSAPQHAIAVGRAHWQGEPVAAAIASTRAEAEDAAALIEVTWRELPAVTDAEAALAPDAMVIHAELGDNLFWERKVEAGDVDAAFAAADTVVEEVFEFARHTGVTPEPRSIIADYDGSEEQLTVYLSTQAPHMMQNLFAKHLGLDEHRVRVICKDVGGAYGIKAHAYGDEFAACAIAIMLKRPVKFIADRIESFASDIHARAHTVSARMAVSKDGEIQAMELDDLTGIGPYSVYPRTSAIESNQILNMSGGQYRFQNYRAHARIVFLNLPLMCQYRAVGHPVLTAVTEGLVDAAAAAIGMDPIEIRRRNLRADDSYPCTSPTGMGFENLSHQASLEKLMTMIDYDGLRAEQTKLREDGIHRGIGFATFIEGTNPSPAFYGAGGAAISAQDGCTIRLEAKGNITCATGVTEQGQGAETIIAQIAASAVGVTIDKVRVITGDTDITPYGGGTWGSRGTGIAGEAAAQAGKALRGNILEVAGVMLQAKPETLDIRENRVVDAGDGRDRLGLDEIAGIAYYRSDTLPKGFQPELVATRHYAPKEYPFSFTNGIQCSSLEVDTNTGFVTLLKHWVVEDCGTVINPQLVDEQVRGGVVQGIGGALYEHCIFSPEGQLLNGNMADYLVPMAAEMPDIEVAHVESRTFESELGAKGAGEAGTGGAPAVIMNAINDALRPLGAKITAQPMTPERILKALGKI